MYEYTTEVFSVGLQGLAPVDEGLLEELAEDGWEPTLMTPVHNGFATLVLFRREAGRGGPAKKAPAKKAAPAKGAVPAKKAAPAPRAGTRNSTNRVRRTR